jgi:hypothetical protein
MVMNGTQTADFIKVLYPTLQSSANFSGVQIACCDGTGWQASAKLTQGIVDAGAEDLLGVVSSHVHTSPITFTLPTTRRVWETEYSDLSGNWSTLVDDQAETCEVSKRFRAFAQYSRTVRPGAVRVGVSAATSSSSLNTTAFVNEDGSIAVNVINSAVSAAPLRVTGMNASAARAWITDNANNMTEVAVQVGFDGSIRGAAVPARGMASLVITTQAS